MRICIVSREFGPFFGAGIGTYASLMTRVLCDAGHEVHVLTGRHPEVLTQGPRLRPGVRFHCVDLDAVPSFLGGADHPCAYSFAVRANLERLHAQTPFDLIEFADYWGEGYFTIQAKRSLGRFREAVLAVRLHTPTRECRELNQDAALDLDLAWLEHQEAESIRGADLLLSPTRSLLEIVQREYGTEQVSAVVVHPFDLASCEELGSAPPGQPDGPPEILYFGRLERRKGVDLLVDAVLALLRKGLDLRLRLVGGDTETGPGGGSMAEFLRSRVEARFGDRIRIEPPRPRSHLGALVRRAAICCFPSVWENFPNVCLEAMALGSVVVASDAGGMAEIIEHGRSGVLVPAGDREALANALEQTLADGPLRRALAAEAPKRVARYCDPARIVSDLQDAHDRARPQATRPPRPAEATPRPLVSVVVGPAPSESALDSLGAQTLTGLEILAIATDAEAQAIQRRLPGARVRSVPPSPGETASTDRSGALATASRSATPEELNRALAVAEAPYFCALPPSGALAPSYLAEAVRVLEADREIAVVAALVECGRDTSGRTKGFVPWGLSREALALTEATAPAAVFRTERLRRAGGWDPYLAPAHEWDLWCRLAAQGERAAVLPEVRVSAPAPALGPPQRRARLQALILERNPGLLAGGGTRIVRMQLAQIARYQEAAQRWPARVLAGAQRVAQNTPGWSWVRHRLAPRLIDGVKGHRREPRH